ncbi:serine/threonine-protein kinase RsbT [Sphaerotilus hippei]|uniref:Serine/threonine-protein kinase RsbT n=1 Tax=Sphaerotilus hippei TaxID=744406 RepID=A0A318GY84_9BURK|nr:ATP-binding protein [Sphaerotilus hippei]PXW94339.1 serine/threonine-protein kinase RsbT [Sphaerotilus hippei]
MSRRTIELGASADLLKARLDAREMAQAAGLGVMDQTRFATAVSELGRNALVYGGGGACVLEDRSDTLQVRLLAEVCDQGPGIADIEQAMGEGYSTSGSLGAGLPGTRRLVDRFDLQSGSDGTVVRIEIVRRRRG